MTLNSVPNWSYSFSSSSPVRPRPVGARLRRRRRACGGRSPCVGDLYRSWSAAARHPPWRRPFRLLPCSAGVLPRGLQRGWGIFCKGTECAVGVVLVWWLALARSLLSGEGRRWRAQIQGLLRLGRGPGRWTIADGLFYFDSYKSLCAMGPLQLTVQVAFFSGGVGRRRGGRLRRIREGSRGFFVIFLLFRVLSKVWLYQLLPYSFRTCLYVFDCVRFLI